MQTPKEIAMEWKRLYDAENDLMDALRSRGVQIGDGAHLEDYAGAIRQYMPAMIQIDKDERFYLYKGESLPNMKVDPYYTSGNLNWTFGRSPNLTAIPHVDGLELAITLTSYAQECVMARGIVEFPNLPRCTKLINAFKGCSNIEHVTIGDAPLCDDINFIASDCTNLKTLRIGALPLVTDVRSIIYRCLFIEELEVQFGNKITKADYMVSGCTALREVRGEIDVSKASIRNIASDCPKLVEIRLKGIKEDIALHESPYISLESARYLISEAQNVSTPKVISLPQSLVDRYPTEMAELGGVASGKGWTITYR